MRIAENWKDYRLIDCTDGEKLELWCDVALVRPDPQVIWKTEPKSPLWDTAHGHYHRSEKGGGQWAFKKKIPESWLIGYGDLRFNIRPTGFKHTGLFPEQAVNWDYTAKCIRAAKRQEPEREIKILNLFGYTGAATLACMAAGAAVTHVDASKGMVQWARENAAASGLEQRPVRWLVDDCVKFVQREIRRGNRYDGIIMDPPSYGRGPKGEIWKIEDNVFPLIGLAAKLLSEDALFFLVNSYTTGLQPAVLTYMMHTALVPRFGGRVESSEIGLPVSANGLVLPCGASGRWFT